MANKKKVTYNYRPFNPVPFITGVLSVMVSWYFNKSEIISKPFIIVLETLS